MRFSVASWKAGFAFAGVSLKLIHASRPPGALRCFNEAAWEAGRVTGLVFRARFVFCGSAKLRGFAARSLGCASGFLQELRFFIPPTFNILFFMCASCSPHHIRNCNLDYHKMIPNIWSHTFQLSHYLLQNESHGAPPPPSGWNAAGSGAALGWGHVNALH